MVKPKLSYQISLEPEELRDWVSWSRERLELRLADLTGEAAALKLEHGFLEGQARGSKIDGFARSDETSVAGRERAADAAALHAVNAATEVRACLDALEYAIQFLWLLLECRER